MIEGEGGGSQLTMFASNELSCLALRNDSFRKFAKKQLQERRNGNDVTFGVERDVTGVVGIEGIPEVVNNACVAIDTEHPFNLKT